MNKRKFFGTIIGLILWSFCVVFFTYAYYDWKSVPTNIVLGIEDLSVECLVGAEVNATNIGPVLNYQDGVISEFNIKNGMDKEMAIDLRLDITNISDNLLVQSLKYAVVTDTTGGTNYDYDIPVLEGDFENFKVGSNIITKALAITPSITQKFQFIVYIDGNMKNDINMQNNNLVANLMIGNCGENAVSMDEIAYQAIYSETDNSLTFIHNKRLNVGDTYNDKAVTAVYTGFETAKYTSSSVVPWYNDGNYANITSVVFENKISPVSTAYWFYGFTNLNDINMDKLNTTNVTNMSNMFRDCTTLTEIDFSNFNTSNVTNMSYMFYNCNNLSELDVSNFDTSKVTTMKHMFEKSKKITSLDLKNFDTSKVNEFADMFKGMSLLVTLDISKFNTSNATRMEGMFRECSSLTNLDVSSFDTSNATRMEGMFYGCRSLTNLDVSSFDTSKVTNMGSMFHYCCSLSELDVSNFNTANVTDMSYMFASCYNLENLTSKFNTSKVTTMKGMFGECDVLFSLDVSNFDTSKVTDMSTMFYNCSSLTTLDLSGWDTSKVTNMSLMFQNCSRLRATITIRNNAVDNYAGIFVNTSNYNEAQLTVNYTPETSTLVDSMIASKSANSNVVKGSCIGTNCPAET